MNATPLAERTRLSHQIRGLGTPFAEWVTGEFSRLHPDWLARYEIQTQVFGNEDLGYHAYTLAGAIEAGSMRAFEESARRKGRMLAARQIEPRFFAEYLEQIGRSMCAAFTAEPDQEIIRTFIQAGARATLALDEQAEAEPAANPLSGTCQLYLAALLANQRQAATKMALEALRDGHRIQDLYISVFQAAQYEVGRLWEAGRISIAQEHMATAITQSVIAQMYVHLPRSSYSRGRLLLTGVEGEYHQVGAHMVADMLEADGWDVLFLGTNRSNAVILKELAAHRPQVLAISVTMLFNLPKVRELLETVAVSFPIDPPWVMLGGAAFRYAPELGAELGAGAVGFDIASAVKLCATLRSRKAV